MTKEKIWYSFFGEPTPSEEYGFYQPSAFSWVPEFEGKAEHISEELLGFINREEEKLNPYFAKELVSEKGQWKGASFMVWGITTHGFKQLPQLREALAAIPHVVSASISLMEPGTDILLHRGDTNAIVRCHYGISIPCQLPECGIEAGGVQQGWENGKVLLFNDAAEHRAWNHSQQRRAILLFDIIRPEFADRKTRVCSSVLTSLFLQKIAGAMPFIMRLPKPVLRGLHGLSRVGASLFLAVKKSAL